MTTTFQELLSLGFTPAAALAIVACAVVWLRSEALARKQNKTRESWHEETRQRVDDMQSHVEDCNKDRELLKTETSDLKVEVATLKVRTESMSRCPVQDCPNRARL